MDWKHGAYISREWPRECRAENNGRAGSVDQTTANVCVQLRGIEAGCDLCRQLCYWVVQGMHGICEHDTNTWQVYTVQGPVNTRIPILIC